MAIRSESSCRTMQTKWLVVVLEPKYFPKTWWAFLPWNCSIIYIRIVFIEIIHGKLFPNFLCISSWSTFITFKQIRDRLALYRYPWTIRMSNKLEIYIMTIKYCTLQQNFSTSHFSKQNLIEIYENIWLINQISTFTNPSSAVICRYCTRFKKLLF